MRRLQIALLMLTMPIARPAYAQLLASEPAQVSQTVDGTRVTIEYSRPRARGRTGLFGTRIQDGHIWTPGANAATTLAVSKDVTINGQAVSVGKYTVWIAISCGDGEQVLDSAPALFRTRGTTTCA